MIEDPLADVKPHRSKFYINESSDDDGDPTHWTLKVTIDPSKHSGLYRFQHKLQPDNYVSWMSTLKSVLDIVDQDADLPRAWSPENDSGK